ncbi:MAG: malto-oligosyltrehalose trehalohydrolase, partial [Nitrospinota bacterium]
MQFGPQKLKDGRFAFNFWAPDSSEVSLFLPKTGETMVMRPLKDGWHTVVTDRVIRGTEYLFQLENGFKVPDPASARQADTVHGPSVLIDHDVYDWRGDSEWKGRPWEEAVIYELHVGTFSEEGTFKGVQKQLDQLVDLGITAIELMPVGSFPGSRNWGYDGVLLFAPANTYGEEDDLKDLIRAAHEKGIMVFLDVVYNHFGPEGNYFYVYAKSRFFETGKKTPWGDALNFNDENVRNFFIQNALFWLETYRFDGLRFDAVHAIEDENSPHILEELVTTVRKKISQRHIHLVLENDGNLSRWLHSDSGGPLYDAQWNDDFHHTMHILMTGETRGYYMDYTKEATGRDTYYYSAKCFSEGFGYQGEVSPYRNGQRRGEPSSDLLPAKFVNFIQNHDQIGNRALGERVSTLTSQKALQTAAASYLLAPSIPLIFMGEEWGSKVPFYFFCDLGPDLTESIREGRRKEFSEFPEFSDKKKRDRIPDPTDKETFLQSKPDWDTRQKKGHRDFLDLYKKLLTVRREKILPLITRISPGKTKS